jgi:AAA15 family ATPase/GTPase
MLIDFAITNFRSIKEREVFSMQTVSRITEKQDNTIETKNELLLRSAVIFGRNASGKSNLMLAADILFNLNNELDYNLSKAYQPYKLTNNKHNDPIIFELNFYAVSGKKYYYFISYNDKEIIEENLYHYPEGVKARLYLRNSNGIKTEISGLKNVYKNTYPRNTILSRIRFNKIEALIEANSFFIRHFVTQSFYGSENNWKKNIENVLLTNCMPKHISNLSKLIKVADTGIDSIEIKILNKDEFNLPGTLDDETKEKIIDDNRLKIKLNHPIYENDIKIGNVEFDIDEESTGTQKLLLFGSSMLDCLSDGDVLFVDELDKGLHPKLMQAIIRIFNNPKSNPNNAQLIFTTHDVSLLGANLFRQDQIWITEKDINGISSYYTIADIKGVRADVPYEKYLLNGSFGGTPVINEFDFEFNLERTDEKL